MTSIFINPASLINIQKHLYLRFLLTIVPLLSLSACSTYLGDFERVEAYKFTSDFNLSENYSDQYRSDTAHSHLTDTELALRRAVLHFEAPLPDLDNTFSLRQQKHLPFTNAESRFHFYSNRMKSDRLAINRFLRAVEAIVWQNKARMRAFETMQGQTHDTELDSKSINQRSGENLRLVEHGFQSIEQRLIEYEQVYAYAALHTPSPLIEELQLSLKLMKDRLEKMRQTYEMAMGHSNAPNYQKYHGKVIYK